MTTNADNHSLNLFATVASSLPPANSPPSSRREERDLRDSAASTLSIGAIAEGLLSRGRSAVTSTFSALRSFRATAGDASQTPLNANVALYAATDFAVRGSEVAEEGMNTLKEAKKTAKAGTETANAWTKTAEKVGYAVSLAASVFVSYYGFKLDSEARTNPKMVSSWQAPFAKVIIASGVITTLGLIGFGVYKLAKDYFSNNASQTPNNGSKADAPQSTELQEMNAKADAERSTDSDVAHRN